jgi:membrane fusion protein (multidrug efflux system)
MHAKAVFTFDANRKGLTLPRKAIVGSLQDPKIYVVVQDTLSEIRAVTVGGVYGERVEVTGGLREGEKVVTTGQLNLSNGARIHVIN